MIILCILLGILMSSIMVSYVPGSGLLPDWFLYGGSGLLIGLLFYIAYRYESLIEELEELLKEEPE